MNPRELLDNIDNLDFDDIEINEIDITDMVKERARKKVKGIITNEKQIIPIKVTSNFRCLISVTIKKYHQQSRIVREVA